MLTTGPIAFAATQQAVGALEFLPRMADMMPVDALGDPNGCLNGTYTTMTLEALYMRQMRCAHRPRLCSCNFLPPQRVEGGRGWRFPASLTSFLGQKVT